MAECHLAHLCGKFNTAFSCEKVLEHYLGTHFIQWPFLPDPGVLRAVRPVGFMQQRSSVTKP